MNSCSHPHAGRGYTHSDRKMAGQSHNLFDQSIIHTHTMYTFYPEDRTQHFAYTRQVEVPPYPQLNKEYKSVLLDGG